MNELRICVYASSSERTPAAYLAQSAQLGAALAAYPVTLINGAGRTGCMGALNDACIAAGGRVEGVILQQFVDDDLHHYHLHEMLVVDTMRERKRLLAQDIQGFIALPGGPGTWEELWEIAVERQIGTHQSPLILINYDGYYDGFQQQLARAEQDQMLYGPAADLVTFVSDADEAIKTLKQLLT